jgi:hypothetical protein
MSRLPLMEATTVAALTTAYQRREWKHYVDGRRETEGGRREAIPDRVDALGPRGVSVVAREERDWGLGTGLWGNCRQAGDEAFSDNAGKRSPHDYE